jgi:hypothetical protein
MHNIEPSKTRPGEYIGYATGSWRIKRVGKIWRATVQTGVVVKGCPDVIEAKTLREVSERLESINKDIAKELRKIATEHHFSVLPNPWTS